VLLGVIFLLLLGYHRRNQALAARNDFPTFYAGATLAGTPDLYSRTANAKLIEKLAGEDLGMMYIRPPFYAAILKPLAWLPFLGAYALFTCLSLASYIWFAARFTKECPALPFLSAISIPFLADLTAGQDAAFMLAILGTAILLARDKNDLTAGLILSLCSFKFHLFLFVPVLLLIKKRWHMIAGGVVGAVALAGVGTIVDGPSAWISWVNILRDPWINPGAGGMPNLHGLVAALGLHPSWEAILIGTVSLLFLWMTFHIDNFELLFAASLVCGLLVSFHSTIVDDLVLFPVLILVLNSSQSVPLRAAAALILTPIPYFLVLAGPPYSALLPICLLLMLGGMAWDPQPHAYKPKTLKMEGLVLPH
jgi:hypothetical protein